MINYRAIVIGANGFIGRILLAELHSRKIEAIGVVLSTSESGPVSRDILESLSYLRPEVRVLNSFEVDVLKTLFLDFKPNIVFQMVGKTRCESGLNRWDEYLEANVITMASVITAIGLIREIDRPMLVVPGSQMEYGLAKMPWNESRKCEPLNSYGVSKYLSTELVLSAIRSHAIKGTIIRLPIVFGPGQYPNMFIPELIMKCISGIETSMTSGRQMRRFLLCKDAAHFFHKVASLHVQGKSVPNLVNAPASVPMTILSVAKKIASLAGKQNLLGVGVLPDRADERIEAWPDSTIADQLNLIKVTAMDQALKVVFDWYRENAWFRSKTH